MTCCFSSPATTTSRTPGKVLSFAATISLSLRERVPLSSDDETASAMIGTSSNRPATTRGVTSLGKLLCMPSTAERRSLKTLSDPVPNSHSTRTVEMALALREVTRVTPETALAASSMGRLTSRSTTSGAAPGCTATMVAAGVSMEGMSSCLRLPVAKKPRPMRIAHTSRTTVRLARLNFVSRVTRSAYVAREVPLDRCVGNRVNGLIRRQPGVRNRSLGLSTMPA